MRRCLLVLVLLLSGCRKEAAPQPAPAPAVQTVAVISRDAGSEPKAVQNDAGPEHVGCRDAPLAISTDAGLTAFAGFSADEKRFAFSTYSEGAGAHLLTVIESPSTLVKRLTLGGDAEEVEAKKLLDEGRFDSQGFASDFEFKLEGPTVHVLSHGVELWKGEPFGAQGAGNLRVEPWGCSRSKTHGAIVATVSSGTEFGDIKTFVIFPLPGAR